MVPIEGQLEFTLPRLDHSIHGQARVPLPPIGEAPASVAQIAVMVTDHPPDLLGLICWAFGDLLLKKLEAELSLIANDGSALTAEARATKVTELNAAILANERDEEELIRLAESSGTEVVRRADGDPRAVFWVSSNVVRAASDLRPAHHPAPPACGA